MEEENKILGLVNGGQNMCFLNVIIQALWNLLSVKKVIFSLTKHGHQIEDEENFNVIKKVSESLAENNEKENCKKEVDEGVDNKINDDFDKNNKNKYDITESYEKYEICDNFDNIKNTNAKNDYNTYNIYTNCDSLQQEYNLKNNIGINKDNNKYKNNYKNKYNYNDNDNNNDNNKDIKLPNNINDEEEYYSNPDLSIEGGDQEQNNDIQINKNTMINNQTNIENIENKENKQNKAIPSNKQYFQDIDIGIEIPQKEPEMEDIKYKEEKDIRYSKVFDYNNENCYKNCIILILNKLT